MAKEMLSAAGPSAAEKFEKSLYGSSNVLAKVGGAYGATIY